MTDHTSRLWARAQRYLAQSDLALAVATLDSMHAHTPGHARTHLVAAQIAWRNDEVRRAASEALEAARVADATPTDSPSATLSVAQVRSSLHRRAFGEWRRYGARLSALVGKLSAMSGGILKP